MHKALKIGLVALLGSSLSGCIAAAAAVPLLAGGGVVGSRVVDGGGGDRTPEVTILRPPFDRPATASTAPAATPTPEPAEIAPEPAAQAAMTAETGLIDPNAIGAAASAEGPVPLAITDLPPTPASAAPAPVEAITVAEVPAPQNAPPTPPEPAPMAVAPASSVAETTTAPGTMPPIQLTLPDGRQIAVSGGGATGAELAPSMSAAPTSASASAIGAGPYGGLYDFALMQSEPLARGERRDSALLTAPGALQPETSRCGVTQSAILIDLDPGDELLDPTARFAPNPPLAQALTSLRERNVSVHWISGNSAAFAGALRSRLEEAGLDPDGKDELVLMRYPDDRKQVRRRAVGATHCLVAIAGEERGDFDELYEYLRSPDAAIALEALVGQGWFLIPPALVSKDEN